MKIQLSAGRGNPVDGIARNSILDFRGGNTSCVTTCCVPLSSPCSFGHRRAGRRERFCRRLRFRPGGRGVDGRRSAGPHLGLGDGDDGQPGRGPHLGMRRCLQGDGSRSTVAERARFDEAGPLLLCGHPVDRHIFGANHFLDKHNDRRHFVITGGGAQMLEPLGLPSHVFEIYRSLLRQPGSVEDLVSSLGWRSERVRSALDECVRLNLAKPSWGAPENLRAVSPEVSRATSVRASANSFCRSRSSFSRRVTRAWTVQRVPPDPRRGTADRRG